MPMIMEGPMPMIMEGTRPPTGASPTQPYKCGQNVKIKIQAAERGRFGFGFRRDKHVGVDVDFKHFDCIYMVG